MYAPVYPLLLFLSMAERMKGRQASRAAQRRRMAQEDKIKVRCRIKL
jgi:hypothetical protein